MSDLTLRTVAEVEAAELPRAGAKQGEKQGMQPWTIALAEALASANSSFVFQMKRRTRG